MQIDEDIQKIHDFGKKLRQPATIDYLKSLVSWARDIKAGKQVTPPNVPLISINMDITTGCDHACGHCVDDDILNSGKRLKFEHVTNMIDTLQQDGLRSVILIGGGEPTLHPNFEEIVTHIKSKNLQLGIVSNGGHISRIENIAHTLTKGDWVRFSVDAATNETYQKIHWLTSNRKPTNSLLDVLNGGARLIKKNPLIELGYSYVIIWNGSEYRGRLLCDNVDEISGAVQNARKYGFTYFSLKPCLIKFPVEGETLMYMSNDKDLKNVVERINHSIDAAKKDAGGVRVVLSQNLQAMLQFKLDTLRKQPDICYAGFLRQVIHPAGIFHCPAYRGDSRACVGKADSYYNNEQLLNAKNSTVNNLLNFHATETCKNIACFYNGLNNYIQQLVDDNYDLDQLKIEDIQDFFF